MKKLIVTTLLTAIIPEISYAYQRNSRSYSPRGSEMGAHLVSTGGGISDPSHASLFSENPSGLIYNEGARMNTQVDSHANNETILGTGGALLIGNGLAAGGIGFRSYQNSADALGNINYFHFGLASHIEPINMTLGLNGAYRLHGPQVTRIAAEEKTWTANIGTLFNPNGVFKLGLTAYNLSENITSIGTGAAVLLNQYSVLNVDASVNRQGKGLVVKPGFSVRAGTLQMSYSYGVKVDQDNASELSAGNTFSLGYQANDTLAIYGTYNAKSLYTLGLSFQL